MTTLKVRDAGNNWYPVAGDVNAQNPVNDFISKNTPTPWTPVAFQNGWVNSGYGVGMAYRKVGDMVEFRGMISGGLMGTVAFWQVNANFPPGDIYVATMSYDAAAPTTFSPFRYMVRASDGAVLMQAGRNDSVIMNFTYSTTP